MVSSSSLSTYVITLVDIIHYTAGVIAIYVPTDGAPRKGNVHSSICPIR